MSARPLGFRRARRAHRHLAAAIARVEGLEIRRLMSATLDDELLTVDGTGGDDDLRVRRDDGEIVVTLNGNEEGRFDNSDVKEIRLSGLGGDDTIRVEANVRGATLRGGDGNDTLLGGEDGDTLIGGDGNDTLDGKEGSDVYAGGDGFDAADYRFETANLVLSIDGVANESGGNADGDDIGLDVERVLGGSGSDRITGSAAANSITGREGNDTISPAATATTRSTATTGTTR
jgi:Ca2+-binding RTX toxin-like protein